MLNFTLYIKHICKGQTYVYVCVKLKFTYSAPLQKSHNLCRRGLINRRTVSNLNPETIVMNE